MTEETEYKMASSFDSLWLSSYPLAVVATNRALGTFANYNHKNIIHEVHSILRQGNFKSLYAGLIPAMLLTFSLGKITKTTYLVEED